MRPISQTGLIRVPSNPNQRGYDAAGQKIDRRALDGVNERLAESGVHLHPTKGFRKVSAKRTRAAVLTSEMQNGAVPFLMKAMKRELALARAGE